jgi:hypothetical protein
VASQPIAHTTANCRRDVRAIFVAYLVLIAAGLAYGIVVGLLQL